MGLSILMYRDYALVTEVDIVTHTDRTIIARPRTTEKGLFLENVALAQDFSEAVRIVDEELTQDAPDEQDNNTGALAVIEGPPDNGPATTGALPLPFDPAVTDQPYRPLLAWDTYYVWPVPTTCMFCLRYEDDSLKTGAWVRKIAHARFEDGYLETLCQDHLARRFAHT